MSLNDFFVAPQIALNIIEATIPRAVNDFVFGESRIGLKLLSIYFSISVFFYFIQKILNKKKFGSRSIKQFIFPKKIYTHPSYFMDLKVILVRMLFNPILFTSFTIISVSLAKLVSENLKHFFPKNWGILEPSGLNLIIISLAGFLIFDFSQYILHRFFHKVTFMWPFHSPHHSAEVLSPFTVTREHYVWDFMDQLFFYTFMGIGQGILIWYTLGSINSVKLFEFNLIFNILNMIVGNFFHSQFWISFGPLNYIFISPAMHQIHHSVDPKHRNKNMGYFLSIWDQMFGTIYIPKEKENLIYGLGNGVKNPHTTLLKFYFLPFKESGLVLKRNFQSILNFPFLIKNKGTKKNIPQEKNKIPPIKKKDGQSIFQQGYNLK